MFEIIRQTIGGWVKRYKETGDCSSRQHLSKGRASNYVKKEKQMLSELDHTFIARFFSKGSCSCHF